MRIGWLSASLLIPGLLLGSGGCLTSTQATRLQTDLDEVKRQLFKVQQDTAGAQDRLASIDRRLESGTALSGGGQADLNATIQSILDQIQVFSQRMEEMQARIAGLHQEIQAQRQPGGLRPPAGVPGSAPGGEATEAFHAAYSDYNKGNYELAIMGFSDFLRTSPDHALGPDAQYWIGECYFSQGRYSDAADAFDRTVRRWPESGKVPAALLKKGLSQMEMGQTSRAVPTLQQVIEEHPGSEEARIAAARLQQLGLRP